MANKKEKLWQNIPSWLKGGIVAMLFYFIVLLFIILIFLIIMLVSKVLGLELYQNMPIPIAIAFGVAMWLLIISSWPSILINVASLKGSELVEIILSIVVNLIVYFLLGALISFVYNKIKMRKVK